MKCFLCLEELKSTGIIYENKLGHPQKYLVSWCENFGYCTGDRIPCINKYLEPGVLFGIAVYGYHQQQIEDILGIP